MPAWLIPVLKSVLPYVGAIVSAAAPVFTKKSADAAANQAILLQQQITELQAAASANDAHIKALAIQMQNTVEAVGNGGVTCGEKTSVDYISLYLGNDHIRNFSGHCDVHFFCAMNP